MPDHLTQFREKKVQLTTFFSAYDFAAYLTTYAAKGVGGIIVYKHQNGLSLKFAAHIRAYDEWAVLEVENLEGPSHQPNENVRHVLEALQKVSIPYYSAKVEFVEKPFIKEPQA